VNDATVGLPPVHVLLGYSLCLVVLTPALSVDVFFALIGATSRLHDLLALLRAVSRMLQSVTSPFKIALTLVVLLGVFASDFARSTRGVILLATGTAGIAGLLQTATLHSAANTGFALVLGFWTVAALLTFSWGSRLLAASTT
jgi:hypothetical protein